MEKKLGTRLCFEVKWQDFRRGEQPSSSTNTRNISPLFIFLKMGGGGGDNPQNIHFTGSKTVSQFYKRNVL